MRGHRPVQPSFVSLINVEALIAADHPIRAIKRMCDEVLREMDAHFDDIYAADGAPSIPPETLLKAKVLQALYTVRSDRQLCARLQTDLLFRWFIDLPLEQAVFDASVGGLGGCPFAPGAAGNTSTEDMVNMLHRMGVSTGIDLGKLLEAAAIVKEKVNPGIPGHLASARTYSEFCFFLCE